MKYIVKWNLMLILLLVISGCKDENETDKAFVMIWEDNFTGEAGTSPNSDNWNFDIGTDWGNNQLEYDTDRIENVQLDGEGHLAIIARKESYEGSAYTSGRITTFNKFDVQYGKIEARVFLPNGTGIWPAFWMLGTDVYDAGWPECGEIDIMEFRGQEPTKIHGSLHGPGYSGGNPLTRSMTALEGRYDTDFHIYGIEWSSSKIEFYVDGQVYFTVDPKDVPGEWVYDHSFFIILNVAVGGNYVGPPNTFTDFPQRMLVDYVRVYKQK